MGNKKDKAPASPPSMQMSVDEVAEMIKKYKGKSFRGISALVTKINQDMYKHQNKAAKQIAHSTVRQALTALGITSTGGFTVPRSRK